MQINNGKTVRVVAEQKDNFQSAPRARNMLQYATRILKFGFFVCFIFPPPICTPISPLPFFLFFSLLFSTHMADYELSFRHVSVYVLTAAILFGE